MDRCKDCNRVNCVCEVCCACESLVLQCMDCLGYKCDCEPCGCEGWDGEDSFYADDSWPLSYDMYGVN